MKYNMEHVIEVLKSGNFTIAYHDNGRCSLYEGKHEYGEWDENTEIMEFDYDFEGYLPREVALLAQVLGGKATSV